LLVQAGGPQERAILRLKALIGPATGKNVFLDSLNRSSSSKPAGPATR
jgi:hypothetical protein